MFLNININFNFIIVCTCNLERDVLWQGKIYPTAYHICFYGKIFAKAAKVTIHFKDITLIEKRSTVGMFPNAIRINTASIEVNLMKQ